MTERLPPPDLALFPPLRPSDHLCTLDVGHQLGRIYSAQGAHRSTWSHFRTWGPTSARFDHHPPPARSHRRRGVLYAAPNSAGRPGGEQPILRTCLAEVYRDRGVIELSRDRPYFALFDITRPLRLLNLADSTWVAEARGTAAISSGLRSTARDWASAIYRAYPRVDGVSYTCSTIPSAGSVALWERARSAIPRRPLFNRPLDDAALRPAVEHFATWLHLDLTL